MTRSNIFYLTCFGFAIGILWRSFFQVGFQTIFFFGVLYILIILFALLILKKNWEIFISIFLIAFLFGIVRFQLADTPPSQIFEAEIGKEVSVSGLIVDEPSQSENESKFTLKTNTHEANTGIAIFSKNEEKYKYGDQLEILGMLEKPKNFTTDQGLEFDYLNYLRKDGIFYTMHNPQISIISSGHGNIVKRFLFATKERFDLAIVQAIPAPESALMGGLTLGERESFSESLRQAFIATGLIHIVAVSGYNVTLVAGWIMKILGFLPINFAIGGGIFTIFLYVIMTGG